MVRAQKVDKVRRVAKVVFAAMFMVLLWLPIVAASFHWDTGLKLNEKRELAAFPKFNPEPGGIKRFIVGLEVYHNDHFGLRNQLIRWERSWKRTFFRESSSTSVIMGKNEWLFYSAEQMIENYHGTLLFDARQLEQWQSLLECRRDWLARRGISYVFVIPPDKHSIYPEYLPASMGKPGTRTKLDQFIAHMKAHSSVEVIDLRPVLLDGKMDGRLYYPTDAHWNQRGAFVAYQELIRVLGRRMPNMKPLPWQSFRIEYRERSGGDLAELMGQEQTMREKDCPEFVPDPSLPIVRTTIVPSLIDKKWGRGKEPVVTENAARTEKAVVFRDSFSTALIPFLGHHFNKASYVWQDYWDTRFIEQQKPDVVIDEMLERFLCRKDPQELRMADDLK